MKAFLIAGLVATTFLSPAAYAAVDLATRTDAPATATATDKSAEFQRGEGRRGGGRAGGQDRAGQSTEQRQGNPNRTDWANRGQQRVERSRDQNQEWRGRDNRGGGQNGWQQPTAQPQPPQQPPVDRRADRGRDQSQTQPQWRDNRRDEQRRGDWQRRDGGRDGQRDVRNTQDRTATDRNWDDRYGNGYDRERGGWDRNDRGHDDRYGNGWNRDQGRWNDQRNDRNDRRYDRNDNRRYDTHRNDSRHDDNRWDSSWRNDRRYDWRSHRNQYRDHYRRPSHYYAPDRNHRYSRFSIGLYIGSGFYHQDYWLNDPWEYRLPPVHGPYRWVRYYDDVLLIDVRNGYVVDVINDFFW
ncbi:MAG: RcnB family protein [Sphingorhabdus sp.]